MFLWQGEGKGFVFCFCYRYPKLNKHIYEYYLYISETAFYVHGRLDIWSIDKIQLN